MSADRRLALSPLGKAPMVFAIALAGVVPLLIAVVIMLQVADGQASPVTMLVVQAIVMLVTLAVVLSMWRREACFDGQRLRVKATWYTRESALSAFVLGDARVVDLREHTEFKPFIKSNGMGLPGLKAGHFRLRDRRKAFCLVTDPAKVLVLPHVDGGVWLLSLQHPQAVLDILRRGPG